jgi:hypothetical protein
MPYAAQQVFVMVVEGLGVFGDQSFKSKAASSASTRESRVGRFMKYIL